MYMLLLEPFKPTVIAPPHHCPPLLIVRLFPPPYVPMLIALPPRFVTTPPLTTSVFPKFWRLVPIPIPALAFTRALELTIRLL